MAAVRADAASAGSCGEWTAHTTSAASSPSAQTPAGAGTLACWSCSISSWHNRFLSFLSAERWLLNVVTTNTTGGRTTGD